MTKPWATTESKAPTFDVDLARIGADWPRLGFASHGARLVVFTNRTELLSRMQSHLPPDSTIEDDVDVTAADYVVTLWFSGDEYWLSSGDVQLASGSSVDDALDDLASALEFSVATAARTRVFVHAGVVGWRGHAIVVPGRSGTGKSTLIAALVKVGATYYSDEYAVLDDDGRIHPFARSLKIREGGQRARRVTVAELGGESGTAPLPLGIVALTSYQRETYWRPRAVSRAEGALGIFDNTVLAQSQSERSLRAIQRALTHATILVGTRGEAHETALSLIHTVVSPVLVRSAE